MEAKVGDKVLYVPHQCWWNHHDHKGERIYSFVHETDFSGNKKGEVAEIHRLGKIRRDPDGKLVTATGHTVAPHKPAKFWEATIIALNADGTADLEIDAPLKIRQTITCPDRSIVDSNPASPTFGKLIHKDAPGLKHDAGKSPHTWHLVGE